MQVKTEDRYGYVLSLSEKAGTPLVTQERLTRPDDNRVVASLGPNNQPLSGTILNPETHAGDPAIEHVSGVLKSVVSYELNPALIEQPNDPKHGYPARYTEVIEVLSEAAYDGLDGRGRIQIVVTTHSPSFLNRFDDRLGEIRLVTRVAQGGTTVKSLLDVTRERLGTDAPDSLAGELWESGLLEDLIAS